MFNFFFNNKKNKTKEDLILLNNDNNINSLYTDPIQKKTYYLEDFSYYKMIKNFKCNMEMNITERENENEIIDTINILGKYYTYEDKYYVKFTKNIKPKILKGKIKINLNVHINNSEILSDSIIFNYSINNNVSNNLEHICVYTSRKNKFLITLTRDIKNEFEFTEIRYIPDSEKENIINE